MDHHQRERRRRSLAVALAVLAAALVALTGCGSSSSDDDATAATAPSGDALLHVALLQIAEADVLDKTVAAFERQLSDDLAPRAVEVDVKNAQGDSSLIQSISRDIVSSDADMLAVIGTPAVISVAKAETRRPVIAIAMGDPVGAKVSRSLAAPGTNVTGSVDFVEPSLVLDELLKVGPQPKTLGTIYDPGNQNSDVWVKALRDAVAEHPGLSLEEVTIAAQATSPPQRARSRRDRTRSSSAPTRPWSRGYRRSPPPPAPSRSRSTSSAATRPSEASSRRSAPTTRRSAREPARWRRA